MKTSNPRRWAIRLFLIVAIVAGLSITRVKQRIADLQSKLAAQTAALHQTEQTLADTRTQLAKTSATLTETKAALETANAEKQRALTVAAAQTKRAEGLSNDLAKTRLDRDAAQAYLARYQAAGLEPEQIVQVAGQLKTLQDALDAAKSENKVLSRKLARLGPQPDIVVLPAGLKAKVLATDAKWHFVVLNAGENQGVLERGELLVSRQGKLIAKAKVSRVQNDVCIADLISGWQFGDVMEGDLAIPASPDSKGM